ncbi:P-loop NTPase fold protein [uncultured Sphingomonas sp.]|uniref:KAP family P-loop NTPase fold protein n=1 Tax=uncultured Sphingomonas sp. TaxID=158754 RepID=UPI0025F69CD4|nr:P-loop NTPase fold protein [uncultured Sphingomonas sp.]
MLARAALPKLWGVGLAKRAASFVIMGSGAEALGEALSAGGDVVRDLAKDSIKDGSNDAVDAVASGFGAPMATSMEGRIARFREGQAAISEMKQGLSQIVETLSEAGMKLPITIVIDELDRCRPTYAIKVLEELKHLFDVPGVAFVLGLHGQQLAHSVSAAYGAGFDSHSYLRRFFNRRYVLKETALKPLVEKLCADLGIPTARLTAPPVLYNDNPGFHHNEEPAKLIADYIKAYDLSARDAFTVTEMLQTFMALTGDGPILLPLSMPLIISQIKDVNPNLIAPSISMNWNFVMADIRGTTEEKSIANVFNEMRHASTIPKNSS